MLAGCETDEPPSDQQTCVELCEDYRWLGCRFESDQFWNPVQTVVGASLNGECSDRCRVYAATYGTVGSACEARMVELMRCTASHELRCLEDEGYALPVVAGCDDAARRVARECGLCLLLPSGAGDECNSDRPNRWYCPDGPLSYEPHQSCYDACQLAAGGEYCCPRELGKCNPAASPMCTSCPGG